jgi:hypothetical protein
MYPMLFRRTPALSNTVLSSSTSKTVFIEFLTIDELCGHRRIVNHLLRPEHSSAELFFVQDLVD